MSVTGASVISVLPKWHKELQRNLIIVLAFICVSSIGYVKNGVKRSLLRICDKY